jgi:hypothetical protein
MRESVADALDAGQVSGGRQSLRRLLMACRHHEALAVGDDLVVDAAGYLHTEEAVRSGALAEELVIARRPAEPAAQLADALVHLAEQGAPSEGLLDQSKTGLSTFRIGLNQ